MTAASLIAWGRALHRKAKTAEREAARLEAAFRSTLRSEILRDNPAKRAELVLRILRNAES